MSIAKLIHLMQIKYRGQNPTLLICEDGSGRIARSPHVPYNSEPLFQFDNLLQLEYFLTGRTESLTQCQ